MILIWLHPDASQRSIVDTSFLPLSLASWHLGGTRYFVKLLGLSALLRSGACTLALRAAFCVVHLHASIGKRGQRTEL